MKKIEFFIASEIEQPNIHANSDELQVQWFMQHYGESILSSLMERIGRQIIKEFQEKPSSFKMFDFSIHCIEIRYE